FHRDAWRCYGVTFSWSTISDLDLFTVNARGHHHQDALKTLWIPAWNELSFLGWKMSVRRWLRLQDPDCPLRSSVLEVLRTLRVQAPYRPLWTKYPYTLLLAPTSETDQRH
ncbi:hypothetical protein DYB28_006399, partial [Aphanomyces astaci]